MANPNKVVRCLSWVAVSSEPQAERSSPDDQSAGNRAFIENLSNHYMGYTGVWAGEIRLVGSRSILSLERAMRAHKEYAQLVEMIEQKAFDVLIVAERDRLGREASLIIQIELLCLEFGIVVVPRHSSRPNSLDSAEVASNLGTTINATVEAALAKVYIQQLVRRRHDGMATRVQQKKLFASNVPYGYRYVYDEDGNVEIVIDEQAAVVIHKIFTLYMQGRGAPYICQHLNELGSLSPRGKKWNTGGVASILNNVYVYAGKLEFNRRSRTGQPYALLDGNHPPIINEEDAKVIVAERQRRSVTRSIHHSAFGGICICSSCGQPMYSCTYHRRDGSIQECKLVCAGKNCEEPTTVREHLVADILRTAILTLRQHADLATLLPDDTDATEPIRLRLRMLRDEHAELVTKKARLLDIYLDGRLDRSEFGRRQDILSARSERIEHEIQQLETEIDRAVDPNIARRRLEEARDSGLQMLELAGKEPERVNAWLRNHFRVYVRRGQRIRGVNSGWDKNRFERIEYIFS